MKRRLFLHLGLSKTGTTSIQSFLRRNPEVLAANGVSYPDFAGARSTHPALAPSVMRPNAARTVSHEALALEIRKRSLHAPSEDTHTPLWSAVFDQIDTSNAHTSIVSYENFYHRPDLYCFDILATRLQQFDVYGIIYLRSQEDWLVSLYSQTVKGTPRTATSLSAFMRKRSFNLNFSTILDDIADNIPINHLIVGDFQNLSSTHIVDDFMEKIGVSLTLRPEKQQSNLFNQSLPYWATLFLLRCNQAQITDETFVKVRRALGIMTPDAFPRLKPGLDVAAPAEREALRAAAAADANRLSQRYGITLTQRTREPVAYRPFDEEDMAAVRNALAPILPRSALEALAAM